MKPCLSIIALDACDKVGLFLVPISNNAWSPYFLIHFTIHSRFCENGLLILFSPPSSLLNGPQKLRMRFPSTKVSKGQGLFFFSHFCSHSSNCIHAFFNLAPPAQLRRLPQTRKKSLPNLLGSCVQTLPRFPLSLDQTGSNCFLLYEQTFPFLTVVGTSSTPAHTRPHLYHLHGLFDREAVKVTPKLKVTFVFVVAKTKNCEQFIPKPHEVTISQPEVNPPPSSLVEHK